MTSIRVAVVTISDTASKDATADKSGPTIKQIFENDSAEIKKMLKALALSDDIDLILTTGGTGFGQRDVTPEAVRSLPLEREAPGIIHLLLSESLKRTPLAALSRPVAGTFNGRLVITLPGSVKAVKENVEILLSAGVLPHAIDLSRGGSGQRVHADLAKSSGTVDSTHHHSHSHQHAHHHDHHVPKPRSVLSHDPSAAVSTRHRQSPYPLISFEEALEHIQNNVSELPIVTLPVSPALRGHVLAEDVYALQDAPPTATTSADGYALRSTDPPGVYKVLTSNTHPLTVPLPVGSIYRVNTGGPLPAGADTVIMVEDTRLIATFEDNQEEKEIETLAQVPTGENVRAPGSDSRKNDLVLQKGDKISSGGGEIGTLAFVGRKEVAVYKKPVVALLSTGNEIVDLQAQASQLSDAWGGIFDTNRPSLQAALEGMGYVVIDLGIVPDTIDAHVNAIRIGLEKADILLTTGGTSMGPTDLLKPVIERQFNGTVHFGRVTIKPGKPTTFATIPMEGSKPKPMFALPGNPASALVTFNIFVVPALRRMSGWPERMQQLPVVKVQLQTAMPLDTRKEFHRVIIRSGPDGFMASSTGGQRSSRVASLSGANGLVILPLRTANSSAKLEVGAMADAIVISEIQMLGDT
ncbi:hypothetical protein BDQ17DRAFT_1398876 [Cyathus striatus]|nr:hypothetical protein BDQ17DRAFT_1398876 [Cyathus striatus]